MPVLLVIDFIIPLSVKTNILYVYIVKIDVFGNEQRCYSF